MSATTLFDDPGDDGESYYIAEDGRLFTLSQDIPIDQDPRIQEIEEIPLSGSIEDVAGIHQLHSTADHGQEIHQIPLSRVDHGQEIHQIPLSRVDDQIQEIHQIQMEVDTHDIAKMEPGAILSTAGQENHEKEGEMSLPLSSDQIFIFNKKAVCLEDFIEIYTIFKCKACDFTSGRKEGLYSHIESTHLSDPILENGSVDHMTILDSEPTEIVAEPEPQASKTAESSENQDLNSMLVITDVNNVKYTMENRTETVILEENQVEKIHSYPYFKFFLVKDQKEIYICTKCSICMSSEDKMKIHVIRDKCIDLKCKNCGARLPNQVEYQTHTLKCKVAVFKFKEKEVVVRSEDENSDDERKLPTIRETVEDDEEDSSLVDKFYQKISENGDLEEESSFADDYKISRLKRNRTDLEVDGDRRVWVCSVRNCYAIFKEEKTLDYHLNCHKGDILRCLDCSKQFPAWTELSFHLLLDHAKDCDLYQCIQCLEYRTVSVRALEKHCQTHANLKLYECDICYKGFNQQVQLKNHSVVHLKESMAELPNWAKPKKCEICQKVCSDSKSLKKHVQAVHSQLKPYICQICGYKSARKANLRLHVRQHSGEKPYQCEECEYKTGDHNSLRRHKKRHSGDKPYKCSLCPFSAIQSSNYRAHLRFKHHITPDGQRVQVQEKKRKSVTRPKEKVDKGRSESRVLPVPPEPERDLNLTESLDSILGLQDRTSVTILADTR